VALVNDSLDEYDETFTLTLSGVQNATPLGSLTATVTILDDDDPPTVQFSQPAYRVDEDTGSGTATITVPLSGPSGNLVQVPYASADGTATAPADYASSSGTLTFNPGLYG